MMMQGSNAWSKEAIQQPVDGLHDDAGIERLEQRGLAWENKDRLPASGKTATHHHHHHHASLLKIINKTGCLFQDLELLITV